MEYNDVPCTSNNLEKPQSEFRDEKLLYLQPAKGRPMVYNRPYKKPTIKIDSDTTYSRSYLKFDCSPKLRINYGIHESTMKGSNTGKFDFDTTYKLSYQVSKRIPSKSYIPQPRLSLNGSHDMRSTHMLSYMDPGYSKAVICTPYRGKLCCPVPMDNTTVMKESYQDFGRPVVKKPPQRQFWRTKFKTDYQTTNQLSYQYIKPVSKIRPLHCRPIISAQIEKDTVYNTSYQPPGHFVNKETVICL